MKFSRMRYVFLLCFIGQLSAFDKIEYAFSHDPIDVIIPCHQKDAGALNEVIASIKAHVQMVRRIVVISSERLTDQAEWIDENIFPFTKDDIALEILTFKQLYPDVYVELVQPVAIQERIGWVYQQCLKLYAAYYIPDISKNVLAVDADVIFLRNVHFLQENGAGLYATGPEHFSVYFEHIERILPGLSKVYSMHSGITHHMLFQKEVLDDLFNCISPGNYMDAWRSIVHAIAVDSDNHIESSSMSEYELYFNFVFARTDQVRYRPLKWNNISVYDSPERYKKKGYHYVAAHVWI